MDDPAVADARRTIESVKAAINMYGGNINFKGPSNSIKKLPPKDMSSSQTELMQKRPSRASELHLAKKKIGLLNQDTKMSETEKSHAELQLLQAKKMVRELTAQIEESKSKTRDHVKVKSQGTPEDDEHEQVTRQVAALKRELHKLNLDMARVLEERLRAEKEAEAASLRLESYMSNAEQLQTEIEQANEEEILLELAKIQARKELSEAESQRGEDRDRFSSQIEESRAKISALREEVEQMRHLEEKLADTNADIQVLQNELNLIREISTRVIDQRTQKVTTSEQLEDVKKKLHSVEGGALSVMTTIDDITNELDQVIEEKQRVVKIEVETENSIKNLNAKLLEAKDKLESITSSEENERFMLSNLSIALENLRQEKQEALREKQSSELETATIRSEIQKIDSETDAMEEKLSASMRELAAAKSAEAKALKKLKSMAEKAAKTRVSSSKRKPAISISSFEYKYLAGGAIPALEVAETKIAAANAWTEALHASERELKVEINFVQEELKELVQQEEELFQRIMEESLNTNQRKQARKSTRRSSIGSTTTTDRRLSGSGGTSFAVKRRTMVMLRLGKYFAGNGNAKQVVNQKGVPSEEAD